MADPKLVAHLLRRTTFGPTAAEIDAAAGRDYRDVVAGLVKPSGVDPVAPLVTFATDPYFGRTREMTREQRQAARAAARDQLTQLAESWLGRMVAARHQLPEKMVFFWHGHWATSAQKVRSALLMRGQLETFRAYGLGDFAVFAKAMVRDPALIVWLDGQRNTRQAPNENLARELMELFTLGIGVYGEDDVKAAARGRTGSDTGGRRGGRSGRPAHRRAAQPHRPRRRGPEVPHRFPRHLRRRIGRRPRLGPGTRAGRLERPSHGPVGWMTSTQPALIHGR
jgi:uncharacterized protein (DUF1800 family)